MNPLKTTTEVGISNKPRTNETAMEFIATISHNKSAFTCFLTYSLTYLLSLFMIAYRLSHFSLCLSYQVSKQSYLFF